MWPSPPSAIEADIEDISKEIKQDCHANPLSRHNRKVCIDENPVLGELPDKIGNQGATKNTTYDSFAWTEPGESTSLNECILQHFDLNLPPFKQTLPPGSTFVYANVAAQYFAMLVPLTVVMIVRSTRGWPLAGWSSSFLLVSGYVVFSRCRGAWLGVAVAMFFLGTTILLHGGLRHDLWRRLNRPKMLVLATIAACGLIGGVLAPLGGSGERRATWSAMWQSFVEPVRVVAGLGEEVRYG